MSARLFVGNLNFAIDDCALRKVFSEVGAVARAEVVRDRFDGRSRGFGFVEMSTPEDGDRAIRELDGRDVEGRPLRVEVATSRRGGSLRGSPRD